MTNLLIVGHESVGVLMTGPSIRCWELARALAREFRVTLAVPEECYGYASAVDFRIATYHHAEPSTLESLAREADAILVSGYLLEEFPGLGRLGRTLIVDVYDPFPIENLQLHHARPLDEQLTVSQSDFEVLSRLLRAGDYFICGSERQRTFWLGMLAANGRINPRTYRADPSFRQLMDVVPMGIPDAAPVVEGRRVKGIVPGIEASDFLLIWPGGVWDWLDPLTAIEAISLIVNEAPDVKLFFPGMRHPHPERVGKMAMAQQVLERSKELGLLARQVFHVDWTPYAERAGYLCDADAALSLHRDGLEAHLAIRARLLDSIWASVPVIATEGDIVADAMAQRGLASLVPVGDANAVAEAILTWRSARHNRARLTAPFHELAAQHRWSTVCRPLVAYLRQHSRAPDRAARQQSWSQGVAPLPSTSPRMSRRWESDEILRLPFDQYQRHRQAAQIVEALRGCPGESLKILDVGGGPAVTQRFLAPNDLVISLDLNPQPGPLSLVGDATRLPFTDDTFDVVATLDTIEHLPTDQRLCLIDECLRVAKRGFILIAPIASSEAIAAENLLFEFIRRVLRAEHEQLREHLQNGLPDQAVLEAHLRERGYPYLVRPSGYVHRWLAMMLLKHYVMSLPQSDFLHQQIDRYYNRSYYAADQRAPSYRATMFVAKTGSTSVLERADQALQPGADPVPDDADDIRDLAQLGLLVQLFALKLQQGAINAGGLGNVAPELDQELVERVHALEQAVEDGRKRLAEREAELAIAAKQAVESEQQRSRLREMSLIEDSERALADVRKSLQQRDEELSAARDLLDRIARGKMMRLMNALKLQRR